MRDRLAALLATVALVLAPAAASATDALKICLDENAPPFSLHEGKESSGFDLAVANAIAKRLGRSLEVQWFETELDNDSSPVTQQDALMADGLCQLIGGYSLFAPALGKPAVEKSRLPSYAGMKPTDRRRLVPLGTLMPSHAYRYAPLTVVLGPAVADRHIGGIGDLQGLTLGAEETTMSDAILMSYAAGRYAKQVTHVIPGRNLLLPRLEKGDFEAAMLPLGRLDAYRVAHPDTKLKASGFYYRIGFNMGFAGLSTEANLLKEVDAAIDDMLAKGEFAALAQPAGVTYIPPHPPDVLDRISILDFYHD